MAALNKTEKLIQIAASGTDEFETKVFAMFLDFFEAVDFSLGDNMHLKTIIYLYKSKHKGETFDNIARSFNRSLSTLEKNRKVYQKMFIFFHDKLEAQTYSVA